jgi:dephospho-CoA kinase
MARTSQAASSRSEAGAYAVGLTGGIGSGKSAVADRFAALGAAIVDTDVIAHAMTSSKGVAIDAIAREFGADFITADGALDRHRMRERVFRDPSAKARLEGILHPRIRTLALVAAGKVAGRAPYVVFVVPLLIESGSWRSRVDRLLVVDCSASTQEARVRARSGLDAALIRSIIAQQAPRSERLDAADDVLVNEGVVDLLDPRVRRLHHRYCEYASGRNASV